MNRRGFLCTLGAVLAGATLDPERLLWRPGAKTISVPNIFPPFPVTHFLTMDRLNKTLLFHRNCFALIMNEANDLPRIGDRITVRRPSRFLVNS